MLRDDDLLREYFERGSEPAFRALQERYAGLVFSICHKQLHDRQLSEDAVQVVFMTLARRAWHLQPGLLKGYLAETARRVSASQARAGRRRRSQERQAAGLLQNLQPHPSQPRDLRILLARALAQLRPEDHELIQLRYYGGMNTAGKIALHLGITHGAAKQRLARAIGCLRRAAASIGAEDDRTDSQS